MQFVKDITQKCPDMTSLQTLLKWRVNGKVTQAVEGFNATVAE
jgi:hypothetical protein